MKRRIAVLGATGSIGRQALEVIEANHELELVAATSGSTPIDGLAPLTQVGGDATDVLERAEPDVVLNAIVGFAGIHATLWALERGVTLALANKESLVAAGAPGREPGAGGGGRGRRRRAAPGRQRALRGVSAPRGRLAEPGPRTCPYRVGRAVSRPHASGAGRRDARRSACAPDVDNGAQNNGGLRDAREQGSRAARGALSLRPPVRPDR